MNHRLSRKEKLSNKVDGGNAQERRKAVGTGEVGTGDPRRRLTRQRKSCQSVLIVEKQRTSQETGQIVLLTIIWGETGRKR